MEYLQLGQYAIVWLQPFNSAHEPVKVYGEPTWASSDPTMLSCDKSTGNPGYAQIRGLKIGQVQLSGSGSYDTGKGIKQLGTRIFDIEIIDQEVATVELGVNYGEVVPISPVKSTETKSKPK